MAGDHNSLTLEIFKQDNALKMSLFAQSDLVSTLRHFSQCAVSFAEINKLSQELTALLGRTDRNGILRPDLISSLKKTGQLLWWHLLTNPVRNRLRTAKIFNLALSIDEELVNIPWELLYDGDDFLCLKFNLGRLVRTKEETSHMQYRSRCLPGVLKMLVLANPTNDLKSAYLEGLNIKNRLDRRRQRLLVDFKSTYIDKLYVKKNLSDYDIVHFAGHCEYEPANLRDNGWVLTDGRFTASDVLAMGSVASLPVLIFSNACQSALNPKNLTDSDYHQKNYSLAGAFLFSGVRHYIGTIRRIEDPLSLYFSSEFYAHLISGKAVGECVRLSRLGLIKQYGIAAASWTSYLLYGDPNFILFATPSAKGDKFRKIKESLLKPERGKFLNKKQAVKLFLSAAIISVFFCFYLWLPVKNPSAYILFLRSQKLCRKGSNKEAVLLASRLIKKDPLFLRAYPLLADAYWKTGDAEASLKCYFDYALISEKKDDKKNLACAYTKIGWLYQQKGGYSKAFDFYNKALALSRQAKDKLNEAVLLRKLAVWYIDKEDNSDKALELLTKSSEINRARQHIYEHKYNLACDYFDMGLVFINKDDLAAAREFYNKSLKYFQELKLEAELSDYYFNLGEAHLFEKEYHKALDCYMRGLKIDEAQGNIPNLASDYNMIGELYLEMDNFAEAEKFFCQSIEISRQIKNPLELAGASYNLGLLHKECGRKSKAREYLREAQEIYAKVASPSYQKIKQEFADLSK